MLHSCVAGPSRLLLRHARALSCAMPRRVLHFLTVSLLWAGSVQGARELSPEEIAAEKEAKRKTAEQEAAAKAEADLIATLSAKPGADEALFDASNSAFGLPIPEAERITNT